MSSRTVEGMDMVTEDNRKERGDYDDFFKIKKKEHHGTLEERMVNLEQDLNDYQELLEVFVQALIGAAGRRAKSWRSAGSNYTKSGPGPAASSSPKRGPIRSSNRRC